ncbi:MAG: AsmA family protein [Caulobacteraceae bacterium]
MTPCEPTARPRWGRRLAVALAVVLIGMISLAWTASQGALIRGPLEAYVSQKLHRAVRVDTLALHPGWAATEADFTHLRIAQPAWAGPGDMLDVPRGRVRIAWRALFGGSFNMPLLEVDQPTLHLRRAADGRANWQFGPVKASPAPFHLPPIRRMVIADGRLDMHDEVRKLVFSGSIATQASGAPGGGPLRIAASGQLDGRPFGLDVVGAPITDLAANRPYPVALHARDDTTVLDADVALATPFDLGHYAGVLHARGDDLSDIYALTGAVTPNTPPYDLTAHIQRDDFRYQLTQGSGRVGGSDLEGDLVVDKINGRRKVQAQLSSRHLVFADLTSIVGNKPHSAAQVVKKGLKAAALAPVPAHGLLPTAPLYVARLRRFDAQVRYRAASVSSAISLAQLDLGLGLEGGVITIDPMVFQFTRGRLGGSLRIDARGAVPVSDLKVRLSDARLEDALHATGAHVALSAPLSGYAQVHGRGLSVHDTAATLSGRAAIRLSTGSVDRTLASLAGGAGLDLSKLIADPPGRTPLRCGLVGFRIQAGRFQLAPAVIDTGVATLVGTGEMDLGAERLDLRVVGHSKRPNLIRVLAPITLAGPLAHPKLGVDRSKVVAQTATGVLSSILSLGGALPFMAGAAAPDVDCAALMAQGEPAPTH